MGYMPKVAKMLGVEVEQVFKIKSWYADAPDDSVYKFTENDFCFYDEETGVWESSLRYTDIINCNAYIIEIPFEPKNGEKYFRIFISSDNDLTICSDTWINWTTDYMCKYCGNCFRTKAEAEAHKYEIYQKLSGRKWEEK